MDTKKVINETSAKIAELNDEHRRSMQGCTVTKGIVAMGSAANEVFVGVRDYVAFTEDNDPYGTRHWVSQLIDYHTCDITILSECRDASQKYRGK